MTIDFLSPLQKANNLLSGIKSMGLVSSEYIVVYDDIIHDILSLSDVQARIGICVPNGRGSNGYNRRLALNLAALLFKFKVLSAPRSLTELGKMLNSGRRTEDTISYFCPKCYPTQLTKELIADVKKIVDKYGNIPYRAA